MKWVRSQSSSSWEDPCHPLLFGKIAPFLPFCLLTWHTGFLWASASLTSRIFAISSIVRFPQSCLWVMKWETSTKTPSVYNSRFFCRWISVRKEASKRRESSYLSSDIFFLFKPKAEPYTCQGQTQIPPSNEQHLFHVPISLHRLWGQEWLFQTETAGAQVRAIPSCSLEWRFVVCKISWMFLHLNYTWKGSPLIS